MPIEQKSEQDEPKKVKQGISGKKKVIMAVSFVIILVCGILFWQSLKISRQDKDLKDMSQAESRFTQEKAGLEKKISSLQDDITRITAQQETLRRDQAQEMQVEIDKLAQKVKEAQNRLAAVNKEKNALLEELNTIKAAGETKKSPDLRAKDNDKQSSRAAKEAEKERLRQEKAQREQEVRLAKASGKKEIAGLQQKITKLNQTNSRLETQLNTAKSQLTEFEKTKKELQQADKKNQDLSQSSDKQKAEIAKLKSDFTALSRLYDQLQAKAEDLYLQAEDASRVPSLEKAIGSLTKERKLLKEQIARQQSQIAAFNMVKAGLMRDVASAYMQGKIFDLAINYYDNSLKLDPRSADAHYKLGLIYKYSRDNTKKALYHFKKYLELTPNAKNRKEVEYLVDMLSQPEIR